MKGRSRFSLGVAAVALSLLLTSGAAAAGPESAAWQLAEKFAPITKVREQQDPPCETSAEQYEPTSVDTVLGNPTVSLKKFVEGEGLEEVIKAPRPRPTSPASARITTSTSTARCSDDTCVYARDFEKLEDEGKAPVTTYAHIATEAGHSGFVLQYWFFWYFNQFNDLHEGDWEGMQISFEADSPAAALGEEPDEIILFQHAGGERADWTDGKVQKEGTHPIVYPAAGSHATFYDSAVYVENGQEGSGLGCDNTSGPLRELRPRPVLLPNQVTDRGTFRWLGYYGRWGEREEGYNNGPTGPADEDGLAGTVHLDGGTSVRPARGCRRARSSARQVTKAFCGVVAEASNLINLDAKSRPAAIATIAIVAIAIALFVGLTRWGPVDLERLRARRSFGQLVRTARRLYGRHWLVLVAIGLTAIPIVGGANLLAESCSSGGGADQATGALGRQPGARRPARRPRPAGRLGDRRRRR